MSLRSPFPIPYGWFQIAWPGDVKVGQGRGLACLKKNDAKVSQQCKDAQKQTGLRK